MVPLFNTPVRREAFSGLLNDKDVKNIFLEGLQGSSVALFLSNLLQTRTSLIIANDSDEAGLICIMI